MVDLQTDLDEFEVFAAEHLCLKFDEFSTFRRKKLGCYFDERDNYFAIWITTKRLYQKDTLDDSKLR